jgi:hypothetical protein
MNNPDYFIEKYIEHLFDCDRLFWLYGVNKEVTEFDSQFVGGKKLLLDNLKKYSVESYSFSRELENWNESNTIKIDNISIGEFQVHQSRASLKFRFQLFNLLNLLAEK